MTNWLQTKQYVCSQCGERLLHDAMYAHVLFQCEKRQARIDIKTGQGPLTISGSMVQRGFQEGMPEHLRRGEGIS